VTTRQAPPGGPLRGFLDDWRIHLRAKNRSRGTIAQAPRLAPMSVARTSARNH